MYDFHYVKLFQLLIKKGLFPLTARFLVNLYTSQSLMSDRAAVIHSVCMLAMSKTRGVLSPILFCVYLDGLLQRLKYSGLGCYIGNVSVPAVSYANDISLMTPNSL